MSSRGSPEFRAGFVALVGRTNVGKSTLLNGLLGEKLAITTPKPQTTRNRILGVKNLPGGQLVLVDTPGLHRPSGRGRTRLNGFMVHEALTALTEVDAVALVTEVPSPVGGRLPIKIDAATRFALEQLERAHKPAILVLNKVDLLRDKRALLPLLELYERLYPFSALVPISALRGDGVERVAEALLALLPVGERLFPEELLTDRAERWLGAELVREQVFLLTRQEIPYSTAVSIDTWSERPGRPPRPGAARKGVKEAEGPSVMVEATIHVDKEAHKRILVGEGGQMIREIGSRARHEIAQLLAVPVHLRLFVRVDSGWTDDKEALRDLGYADE